MENQNPPPFPPNPNNPNNPNNPYNPQHNNPQGNPYQQNPYQQNPYQQQQQPFQQNPFGMQRELPNATAILVLGIISIVTAFCWGIPGVGCGIAALIMGNKATRDYEMNPAVYTVGSYNNSKAGKICGIIGLVLGSIMLILFIIALNNPYRHSYYYW